MKTGIIFDMDGTLWDSAENVAKAWTETLEKKDFINRIFTKEDMMSVMGKTMDVIAEIFFCDLEEPIRTELLNECCIHENEYLSIHGGVLYPRLEETFKKLMEKGYDLYIVSNCQSGYIEAFLDYYGFGKYIKDKLCFGDNSFQKGKNIRLLCDRNQLEKAVYVGDIQGDYDSSCQAGIGFIHAAYGFGTINEPVPAIKQFSELAEMDILSCMK